MEKLKIKHLAPYLPYEFKGKFRFQKSDELFEVLKLERNVASKKWSVHFLNNKGQILWCNILDFRPILRPLSDLIKEIEHNGEKFIPLESICIIYGMYDIELMSKNSNFEGIYGAFGKMKSCGPKGFFDCDLYIDLSQEQHSTPFFAYQKLVEWHFDVFGLIKKGLAIDINTLKI